MFDSAFRSGRTVTEQQFHDVSPCPFDVAIATRLQRVAMASTVTPERDHPGAVGDGDRRPGPAP